MKRKKSTQKNMITSKHQCQILLDHNADKAHQKEEKNKVQERTLSLIIVPKQNQERLNKFYKQLLLNWDQMSNQGQTE